MLYYRWGNTPVTNLTTSALPTLNAWSHVVVTHTGTTASIYINAAPAGSGTVNAKAGSGGFITLGRLATLSAYYFNGRMDDFKVES
jgi:hypothetical protein